MKKRILSLFMACVMLISMTAVGLSSITAFAYTPSATVQAVIDKIKTKAITIGATAKNTLNNEDLKYIFSQSDVDYSYIKYINIWYQPITDISIIFEKAINVQTIDMIDCAVNDLSNIPVNNMVEGLYLSGNDLKSLNGIENLPNLDGLVLSENPITDISYAIENLPRLGFIDARNCQIKDLTNLPENGTLMTLLLSDNPLNSLSGITQLENLQTLFLDNCSLTYSDLGEIFGFEKLRSLSISNNDIRSINWIDKFPNLWSLNANGCNITDISQIPEHSSLETLRLNYNHFSSVDGIERLVNLDSIYLNHCDIKDVSAFSKFEEKEVVWTGGLWVQTIKVKIFDTIDLSYNNITDVSWLHDYIVGTDLDLSHNNISETSAITACVSRSYNYSDVYSPYRNMIYVDISYNNLYRYDKELAEFVDYMSLNIDDNDIMDGFMIFSPYNNENFSLFNSEIKPLNFDDIKIDEAARTITFNSYPGSNALSCYNYGNSTKTSAFQFNIPVSDNISLIDNCYTFTRPVGSNTIVTTLTLKDTTNYYKTSQYTLIINFTVKGITASNNAPTVIDKNHGFIYGLTEGIKNLDGYVAAEEGNLQYVPTPKGFGTGSTAQLIFNGEVMQTYTIVIFGDLNGDGVVDAFDQTDMISTVNFETQYEENSSNKFAGDLNGDGVLDAFDLSIITAASNCEYSINQSGV